MKLSSGLLAGVFLFGCENEQVKIEQRVEVDSYTEQTFEVITTLQVPSDLRLSEEVLYNTARYLKASGLKETQIDSVKQAHRQQLQADYEKAVATLKMKKENE